MPTAKPRVMVTMDQGLYELIGRMAVTSGSTRSAVVRDVLESFAPMIEKAVRLSEQAKAAKDRITSIPPELDQMALRLQAEALELLAGLEKAVSGKSEVTPVSVIRGSELPARPVKPRKGGSSANKV